MMDWIIIDGENHNCAHFTRVGTIHENILPPHLRDKTEYYFYVYVSYGSKPIEFSGKSRQEVERVRTKLTESMAGDVVYMSHSLPTFTTKIPSNHGATSFTG